MKQLSLLTIFVFFCIFSNAQDTIVKLNGDKIGAKIIDKSATEIQYKKFSYQDGPTYTESKSNIQLIKYANGSEEKFESQHVDNSVKPAEKPNDYSRGPVNTSNKIEKEGKGYWYHGTWMKEREMQKQLLTSNDPQISLLVGSAKKYKNLQLLWLTAIPSVLLGEIFLSNLQDPETRDVAFDVPGIVLFFSGTVAISVTSIYFRRKHNIANNEAVKLYNAKY